MGKFKERVVEKFERTFDYPRAVKAQAKLSSKVKKFVKKSPAAVKAVGRVPKRRVRFLQRLQPAPALSQEQSMLQEVFGSDDTIFLSGGTSESSTRINGVLRSGGGIMNNGDDDRETASIFGF